MLTAMVARGCLAVVLAGLALSLAPIASADEGCERHQDGHDGHDHPEACRAAASVQAPAHAPGAMPASAPQPPTPTPAVRSQATAPPAPSPAFVTPRQPQTAPAATVAAAAGLTVLALLGGGLLARRRLAAGTRAG